jgi:peptide chain release factor 1
VACTVFSHELLDSRPGQVTLEVAGAGAARLFAHEPGGHRWQRVPPTERRGRRHTSTVTVVVLPVTDEQVAALDERDVEWQATRGSGAGGQARNKTSNAVMMKHKPTGISVRVESERSQWQNKQSALRMIAAKLAEDAAQSSRQREGQSRRAQVGSGMRGDKIRTVRLQDDNVVDHRSGKRMNASRYMRGYIAELQ